MLNQVLTGATIHADENRAYGALRDDYEGEQINHSADEYERDGVHTNAIESLWARLSVSIWVFITTGQTNTCKRT